MRQIKVKGLKCSLYFLYQPSTLKRLALPRCGSMLQRSPKFILNRFSSSNYFVIYDKCIGQNYTHSGFTSTSHGHNARKLHMETLLQEQHWKYSEHKCVCVVCIHVDLRDVKSCFSAAVSSSGYLTAALSYHNLLLFTAFITMTQLSAYCVNKEHYLSHADSPSFDTVMASF